MHHQSPPPPSKLAAAALPKPVATPPFEAAESSWGEGDYCWAAEKEEEWMAEDREAENGAPATDKRNFNYDVIVDFVNQGNFDISYSFLTILN